MRRTLAAGLILAALVVAGVAGRAKEPVQPSISCILPSDWGTGMDVYEAVEVDDSCGPLVPGQRGIIE
jgi:hypothetical protein